MAKVKGGAGDDIIIKPLYGIDYPLYGVKPLYGVDDVM